MAGLRVGFVLTEQILLNQLTERLGPWPIAHASRYIAQQALLDTIWQQQCRIDLVSKGKRLKRLLSDFGLKPSGSCDLFQWFKTNKALSYHQKLAQQGILTRVFDSPASLRFGLPKTEHDWQRLQKALQQLDLS